jgi:hypothetical protein
VTRRTALLACLGASTGALVHGMPLPQGVGVSITPGQPTRFVIALGSSPYETGTLQIMFEGQVRTFTSREIWDALK